MTHLLGEGEAPRMSGQISRGLLPHMALAHKRQLRCGFSLAAAVESASDGGHSFFQARRHGAVAQSWRAASVRLEDAGPG